MCSLSGVAAGPQQVDLAPDDRSCTSVSEVLTYNPVGSDMLVSALGKSRQPLPPFPVTSPMLSCYGVVVRSCTPSYRKLPQLLHSLARAREQ